MLKLAVGRNMSVLVFIIMAHAALPVAAQGPDAAQQGLEMMASMMPVSPWSFYPDDQVLADFSGTVTISFGASGNMALPKDNDGGETKCSADLSASLVYTTMNGHEQTSTTAAGRIIETYFRRAEGVDAPGHMYEPPRRERHVTRYTGPSDNTPIHIVNLHFSRSMKLASFQMQIGQVDVGRSQISHLTLMRDSKINEDPPDRSQLDDMALFFSLPPHGTSGSRWAQLMRGRPSAMPWAGPFYYESSSANGATSGSATFKAFFHDGMWATREQWETMGQDPGEEPIWPDDIFWPGKMTVRWSFVTKSDPGEMTIAPETPTLYEQWIPAPMPGDDDVTVAPLVQGGQTAQPPAVAPLVRPDENAVPTIFGPAGPLYVTARIKPRQGQNDPPKGRIHFHLSDVTRNPGTCNDLGEETDPDLYFVEMPGVTVSGDGQHAYTENYVGELTVGVAARDTGAWGVVQASCDDLGLLARDERTGRHGLVIPLDDNQNRTSDAWDREFGIRDSLATDDEDNDGWTLYEEYRGFWTDTGFIRTNPRVADR
jgi:hypothetical protein